MAGSIRFIFLKKISTYAWPNVMSNEIIVNTSKICVSFAFIHLSNIIQTELIYNMFRTYLFGLSFKLKETSFMSYFSYIENLYGYETVLCSKCTVSIESRASAFKYFSLYRSFYRLFFTVFSQYSNTFMFSLFEIRFVKVEIKIQMHSCFGASVIVIVLIV